MQPSGVSTHYRILNHISKIVFHILRYDDLEQINWTPGNKILLATHGWHDRNISNILANSIVKLMVKIMFIEYRT